MLRYFLLVNIYALLLFALYLLLLRNTKASRWSRFYLLLSVCASIVLPFVQMPLPGAAGSPVNGAINILLPTVEFNQSKSSSLFTDIAYWYFAGLALVSARLGYQCLILALFLKKQQFVRHDRYRIARNTGIGPGSFGTAILFPGNHIDPVILKHEEAHLRCRHHYDKLLLQVVLCAFFPVIPFYFIRKELSVVHEFEADALALDDRGQYAQLLIGQQFQVQDFHLLQSFFHHPLKRRIQMIYKNQTPQGKRRGLLIALSASVMLAGIVLQADSNVMAQSKTIQQRDLGQKATTRENIAGEQQEPAAYQSRPGQKTMVVPSEQDEHGVYNMAEKVPEYPGGHQALMSFLSSNMKYPETARKAKIEGRVVAKFVINEAGKVERAEILRSVDSELDAEALRVIRAMPDWTPGEKDGKKIKVYYTMPIQFRLGN